VIAFDMAGRQRVPGQDMKELVCKIEISTDQRFLTIDQDRIKLSEMTGRSRNAFNGINVENKRPKLFFGNLREVESRKIAKLKVSCEAFTQFCRVFKTCSLFDPETWLNNWRVLSLPLT